MRRRGPALVVALLGLLFLPADSPAAVEQARIRVEGMACPFCAFNIEKRVKKLDGVDKQTRLKISVETGLVRVPWNGRRFDPAMLREAIVTAGFTPGELSVRATGTLSPDASGTGLRLADKAAGLAVAVRSGKSADQRTRWEALRSILPGRKAPLHVRVEGVVPEPRKGAGSWTLTLERWQPLDYRAEVLVRVRGLSSDHRTTGALRSLRSIAGVIHARAEVEAGLLRIWTETAKPDLAQMRGRIEKAGLKVEDVKTHAHAGAKPK